MVFSILGANTESAEFEVSNSLRFNENDSPKLQETTGSNSNRQRFTFSAWVKKSQDMGEDQTLFSANDGGHQPHIKFDNTSEQLNVRISDSDNYNIKTSRSFRDPSAWYHIVVAMETTQGTAANRVKIYVNGVQETSLSTTDYPAQNYNSAINTNTEHTVGRDISTNNKPFDGYMAEVYFVDGSQLDPTYFGKFNDNGVWIPVELNKGAGGTITFGTHGFYFEFKQTGTGTNSSGIGADTSGNDNHLAPSNLAATDITTDTPTNNFCTMNPLISFAGASDGIDHFREGNTVVDSNNDTSAAGSTFGVQNGKWYYEAKLITGDQSSTNFVTGWASVNYEAQKGTGNGVGFMSGEDNIAIDPGGNLNKNNSSTSVFGNRSTNDIFQVAVDLDNGKIHFGVNGTYSNGSATNSTTLDASNPDYSSVFNTAGEFYMPAFGQSSSGQTVLAYNFGNPSFSISSGNADANGYGNFEYAVPSGYYALCTKNLAEFG